MNTTPDPKSFRVPTPADLRAIGYSDPDSELLPLIFAELKGNKWRTPSQLAAAIHRSKKLVSALLNEAHKRGHVTKRFHSKKEHAWTLGEKAGLIPSHNPDLLADDELPTDDDFWANGFTTRPGQYAAEVVRILNNNGGELPGAELAAKLGIEWPNLGFTLRPMQVLGCTSRIERRCTKNEKDKIVLNVAAVRSLLRADGAAHARPLTVSRELKTALDSIDGDRVRCWPRLRKTIEVVSLHPDYTVEQIAKAVGCDPGGLYGTKQYPGPLKILDATKIVKRPGARRVKNRGISLKSDRVPWVVDVCRIRVALPRLSHGELPSRLGTAKRKARFGQVRRLWENFDPELLAAAETFDREKAGIDCEETATGYLNIAAAVGRSFKGTRAELAKLFGKDKPHEATLTKYVRRGSNAGFFTVEIARDKGGFVGLMIEVNRDRILSCAGELPTPPTNGHTKASPNGAVALTKPSVATPSLPTPQVEYGVILQGLTEKVLIAGKEKNQLPEKRYGCLLSLIEVYPGSLKLNQFPDTIGDPYQALKGLMADKDFEREIIAPRRSGRNSQGYRLARPGRVKSPPATGS